MVECETKVNWLTFQNSFLSSYKCFILVFDQNMGFFNIYVFVYVLVYMKWLLVRIVLTAIGQLLK